MVLLALFCALGGFASLAMAMDRHRRKLLGHPGGLLEKRLLQSVGGAGLLASYSLIVLQCGWALGSIAWFGVQSAAAAAVLLFISQKENAP